MLKSELALDPKLLELMIDPELTGVSLTNFVCGDFIDDSTLGRFLDSGESLPRTSWTSPVSRFLILNCSLSSEDLATRSVDAASDRKVFNVLLVVFRLSWSFVMVVMVVFIELMEANEFLELLRGGLPDPF